MCGLLYFCYALGLYCTVHADGLCCLGVFEASGQKFRLCLTPFNSFQKHLFVYLICSRDTQHDTVTVIGKLVLLVLNPLIQIQTFCTVQENCYV